MTEENIMINFSFIPKESQSLIHKLQCKICAYISFECFINPKCLHIYCENCLSSLTQNKFYCLGCLKSNKHEIIDRRKLHKYLSDYYIKNIIVNCEYESFGCIWKGPLNEIQQHIKEEHFLLSSSGDENINN